MANIRKTDIVFYAIMISLLVGIFKKWGPENPVALTTSDLRPKKPDTLVVWQDTKPMNFNGTWIERYWLCLDKNGDPVNVNAVSNLTKNPADLLMGEGTAYRGIVSDDQQGVNPIHDAAYVAPGDTVVVFPDGSIKNLSLEGRRQQCVKRIQTGVSANQKGISR